MEPVRRYRSPDEDSGRWAGFPFREDDIVISARSKSGTTWVQMICALLIFQTRDLPAPLATISPWLDWLIEPIGSVVARLERQTHRRFVKTHTPLDGVPIDPRATYLVVARDPLDMAVSLYHQGDNLDRERIAELTGRPYAGAVARPPLDEWLRAWTMRETNPMVSMDSLQGVVHHTADAADRRDDRQVLVLRYEDLVADLAGWMRWLAGRLAVDVDPLVWPDLVDAASFDSMRADAATRAPDRRGVLKDPAAFFRRGRPGAGREVLTPADVATYEQRVRRLVAAKAPDDPAEVLRLLGVPAA